MVLCTKILLGGNGDEGQLGNAGGDVFDGLHGGSFQRGWVFIIPHEFYANYREINTAATATQMM